MRVPETLTKPSEAQFGLLVGEHPKMKELERSDEDTSVRGVLRSLLGTVAKTLLAFFANNAIMAMG